MIKKYDKVIHSEPFAFVDFVPNWNNSMYDYYPELRIYKLDENLSLIETRLSDIGNGGSLRECGIEVSQDDAVQAARYAKYLELKRLKKELIESRIETATLRLNDTIFIFKGRKYQFGTTGKVFWIGTNQYGTSVGFETSNGTRNFVSIDNVKKLVDDQKIDIVLGRDKYNNSHRVSQYWTLLRQIEESVSK